ncbi:MAG: hypothetical protein ABIR96_05100 [Bdellovibrionota bacterium]
MEYLFKPRIIKAFTQQVNNFLLASQLQVFKAWRDEGGAWIYELRFFPGPKKGLLLGWDPETREWAFAALESAEDVTYGKAGLEASQDPVSLFVKAHAINRRVEGLFYFDQNGAGSWELKLSGGVSLLWEREGAQRSRVKVSVRREGEKDFSRSLDLGTLKTARGDESAQPEDTATHVPTVQQGRMLSKAEKLVEKVQGDVETSRHGLDELQGLCSFLEMDPQAWGRSAGWSPEAEKALIWVRSEAKLPPFQIGRRAEALETIHDLRRRYRRKLQGSQKRLLEVAAKFESQAAGEVPPLEVKAPVARASHETKASASKGTGQWVEHPSGLRAKLGRNVRENAQLYREAGSRDLWFHIRGLGGSHVWVPRGQPLFGGKDEGLRDDLELWACQLAVYNSKARHARYGVVDITEKRHLKAARGQEGTLLIGRSETRMADLDESFEKWLKT